MRYWERPKKEVEEKVKMAALIQLIARQAQLTFSKKLTDETSRELLSKLRQLANQVVLKDVGLTESFLESIGNRNGIAPVTFIPLFENDCFSISVFVIRPEQRIPLHDHPNMRGMIKVIYGTAKIQSYNPCQASTANSEQSGIGSVFSSFLRDIKSTSPSTLVAEKMAEVCVTPDSELCCLTPTNGNLHEISAVGGVAAFLDILAPPYFIDGRECRYYQIQKNLPNNRVELSEVPAPSDFWCDEAEYTGPPIDV